MAFETDKYCAEFGGVKLFVERYSFERNAALGETMLNNGSVFLHNGGSKAVRVKLVGTADKLCADLLDLMLSNGERVPLRYGGMVIGGAVLVSYKCEGESGGSERVTAEFAAEARIAEEAEG